MAESIAGRSYAQAYRVARRDDIHRFLAEAVEQAGGQLLFISEPDRAPIYLGVQSPRDERLGLVCYPFRCNPPPIKGRPLDEHRFQIRYGGEASWSAGEHPVGLDVAGVDTTIMLGVHLEAGLFIGVDPRSYDPLPMGISIEFRQSDVDAALAGGWHVWERQTRAGRRRSRLLMRPPRQAAAFTAWSESSRSPATRSCSSSRNARDSASPCVAGSPSIISASTWPPIRAS